MRRPRRVRRADRARHWSADVVCWVPAALRLMPSETRERDAGAAAVADPAPPRTRGRGGVGLAEGARCGGRVASVVDRGRWHRSAEVVRGSRSAPRRCRGSPPPRRLAIARNLSLTAALKFVVKPALVQKLAGPPRESVLRYFTHTPPSLQRAAVLTALRVTARRSAVPAAAKAPRATSARTRIFALPLYSTAAGQATPWAKKGSSPPQQRRARRVAQ